ncbi:hypothetical protein H310_14230 [Aphanomyces invadans]|uniref:PH domain-containing protein n=1 Tax=Aphanomyces invadans TaxID=157072 RepID=A0A024TBT6_9STRA|nr:hypothetical protein H310_14230 [Aphanomyces invadans]ETV91066.1 hypothetical protein H310_14230 [Aphanomyces invadans]RHY25768.1 hypothetical protein DYB32_008111 [Aphanomyces invadans]|eukprot:XP_008880262.1 hypothetical protein H310_14230 [Aphanomyces invadans]
MVLLKRGCMYKQGSGAGFFQRKNWKKRYFVLTQDDLRYFDEEQGVLKGCLDLSECTKESLETLPSDVVNNTPTSWCLAIRTPSRRFIMSFATEADMHGWAFAFLEAFKMNEDSGRNTYVVDGRLRGLVKEQKLRKHGSLSKLKMTPHNHAA